MTVAELERGYWDAYDQFYQWNNIFKGAMTKEVAGALRHLAYAGGWKKFEWLWHTLIRMKQVTRGMPLLEKVMLLGGKQKMADQKSFHLRTQANS